MDRNRMWHLLEAITAAIVATAIIAIAGVLLSGGWEIPAGLVAAWLLAIAVVVHYLRSRLLWFRRPMSLNAARLRIDSAREEIWSFQISGSEFTVNSVEVYEKWLDVDRNRRLSVAFANPANDGLLRSLVKLSGAGKMSTEVDALTHLREVILTSLGKYLELKESFPTQVDLRIYDCSPPCSIHAIDPTSDFKRRSIYVECYLPHLPTRERPSLLLTPHQSYYARYVEQSRVWFKQATRA
jgi:hypothetical protein